MTNAQLHPEHPIVHIVDDDDAVRYALTRLCDSANLRCQAYASGEEFLDVFKGDVAGCLVIDIKMPGMSGLEVQRTLIDKVLEIPVIVITGHGDIETGIRAMKSGAFDFIQKPFTDQALLDAIQAAVQKHTEQRAGWQEREHVAKMFATLSQREREVLDEIVNGEPNKRIAAKFDLSEKTIEYHRANIMKKLAARSLADLIKKTLSLESH